MNTRTKQNTMTLRVSDELKEKIGRFAELTGSSISSVANAAVEEYLSWRIPQLKDLKQAIKDADAGKFASKKEVEAVMKKWGYAKH